MSFKVFFALATILFAYCDASIVPNALNPETAPNPSNSETVPKAVDVATVPVPLEPTTLPVTNQTTNIQQCEEKPDDGFGDASRVTCDLFASEPLCAAHCLLLGNAGGYCNAQKVCVCRPRQKDELVCGGGCVTSSQCASWGGTTNCRCAWFGCNLYSAEADLTDVEQFELFLKAYSGNTIMLNSAEKAYRKRH